MAEIAAILAATIRSRPDRVRELAARMPSAEDYAPDELEQLLHGFERMLLEELEGGGGPTRQLYLETAVPAVVSRGRTAAQIAEGTIRFGILLTVEIVAELAPEDRGAGAERLAAFFAEFGHDAVATAVAEGGSG
jgi:hypothetical protein